MQLYTPPNRAHRIIVLASLAAVCACVPRAVSAESGSYAPALPRGGAGGGRGPRPPAAAILVHAGEPIPADGSFLLDTTGLPLGEVTLSDDTGAVIQGQAVALQQDVAQQQFMVWTPSQPLDPARSYTLTVRPAYGAAANNVYPISVTQASPPERPEVTCKLEVTRSEYAQTECCDAVDGGGAPSCFDAGISEWVHVDVALATEASSSRLTQLLFGASIYGDDEAPSRALSFHPFRFYGELTDIHDWTSNHALMSYCVTLEVVEIRTGQRYQYPDLEPRCVPHGDLGEIGDRSIEPSAAALGREVCSSPPPGYEQRWCSVNAGCAQEPSLAGCERFDALCRGGSQTPGLPAAGTGGAGATMPRRRIPVAGSAGGGSARAGSDAQPVAGSKPSDAPSDESAAKASRHVKSCSALAPSAGRGGTTWLGLLLFGAVLVRCARTRARQRRPLRAPALSR